MTDVYYMIAHYSYMKEEEQVRVRKLAREKWPTKFAYIDQKPEFCLGMASAVLSKKDYDRYSEFMKTKYGLENFLAVRKTIEKLESIWERWMVTMSKPPF